MTDSVYPATGGFVDNTSAATFIPEIWSDEIVAAYQKNLVLANLVKKMSMAGKKGDTIHVPKPVRGDAHAKAENTAVTVQNATEGEVQISIDKHFEYSRLIEDITDVQALSSLRQFYTEDAGYALAKQVDTDLHSLATGLGSAGTSSTTYLNNGGTFFVDATNGLSTYAADTVTTADVFTDAGFRAIIQKLDDADVPMENRCFVIPPSVRNTIMGIDRYVSSDFVNNGQVTGGQIGQLYGIDVFVSTNCPVVETAADNTVSAVDSLGALLFQKDAIVMAEQLGVRSQTQYKQEFLANLFTSDTLYGVNVLRPESGLTLVVPK
ncbi:N4-gp56 family major capsid protein [Candidatus Pelagibacter bacterium]|jgi:N4-gp56 family major capsid protein|nr:N4-gp56 family major capsid protein [Candidatus Pelagibacter bacterium]MDA8834536.1 N4-gp56 family major capsid protein [Candidatus Pelagibacter bacterium]